MGHKMEKKVFDKSCCRVFEVSDANPLKTYGWFKTNKVGNHVRVITTGCDAATENLSILIGKC